MFAFKREIAPLLLIYIASGLFYIMVCSLIRKARKRHIHRSSRKGLFIQRLLEFLYGASLIGGSVLYLPWAAPNRIGSTFCQYAWVWEAPKHCMNSLGFAIYHFRVVIVTIIIHVVFTLLMVFYVSLLIEGYRNRKRQRKLREERKQKKPKKKKKAPQKMAPKTKPPKKAAKTGKPSPKRPPRKGAKRK